jgi:HlyD family secretion protein
MAGRRQFRRWLGWVVLVVVVALTGSLWWVGAHVRSSREALADAAPPPPGVVSVVVTNRVVAQTLTLPGTVAIGSTETVNAPSSVAGGTAVVTRVLPHAGEKLDGGELVADVSGRPVFVMAGSFPMYRALGLKMSGPDVAELQGALEHLGYGIADSAGYFGRSTLAAVKEMYAEHGYQLVATQQSSKPDDANLTVPPGELAFVPRLPAMVERVNSSVGTVISGSSALLTLSEDSPEVQVSLANVNTQGLAAGLKASIDLNGQPPFPATVSAVPGSDASNPALTLLPVHHVLSLAAVGDTATAVITVATTRSPVLAVPVSALRTTPGGGDAVAALIDGRTELLPVVTGLSGDGYVQIAHAPSTLRDGTRIAITAP